MSSKADVKGVRASLDPRLSLCTENILQKLLHLPSWCTGTVKGGEFCTGMAFQARKTPCESSTARQKGDNRTRTQCTLLSTRCPCDGLSRAAGPTTHVNHILCLWLHCCSLHCSLWHCAQQVVPCTCQRHGICSGIPPCCSLSQSNSFTLPHCPVSPFYPSRDERDTPASLGPSSLPCPSAREGP